ncbi:MAG: hypothetical protein ACM3UV_03360 [Nocardioidaceae bacterium]
MPHRILARGLALALVLALAAIGTAVAAKAPKKAPNQATVLIKGGLQVKINSFAGETFRFAPGATAIRSGGQVTVKNRTEAPHTLSLVKRSQLPRNARQVESCSPENAKSVCAQLFVAHGATEDDQPPSKPLVDVGDKGFDRAGDSIVINPNATVRFKITAKKGSTLHYLCGIHPWMQGSFNVR